MLLTILQQAYDHPVDVEFTANFVDETRYKIDLVQCRPFQVREAGTIANPPARIEPERLVLEAHGAVIGHSRIGTIDRLIYVVASGLWAIAAERAASDCPADWADHPPARTQRGEIA
jgi:hypothetical protein